MMESSRGNFILFAIAQKERLYGLGCQLAWSKIQSLLTYDLQQGDA